MRWLVLSLALLVAPVGVWGQGRGSGAILGRVTEAGTGRPIRGATVTAGNAASPTAGQALAASDGIFFLTALPPGPHTITATYGGYETASVADYPVRSAEPVLTTPGPVLFALRRAGNRATGRRSEGAMGRRGDGAASRPNTHMEARVRWETHGDVAPPGEPGPQPSTAGDRFVVVEIHRYPGERPRQRTPELSEEQVLVVGTDRQGRPRDWALVPDPGLIRAEGPGPDGTLTGETHRLAGTELLVTMPADPGIAELHFYRPQWTGTLFALEFLGTARFPALPARSGERALTPSPDR